MTGKSWNKAEDACRSHGANLVKINSLQERKFLVKSFTLLLNLQEQSEKPWCGLSSNVTGGSLDQFRWVDQSLPSVTYWVKYNKTLGWPHEGSCVVLQPSGRWVTKNCFYIQPYICKKGDESIEIYTNITLFAGFVSFIYLFFVLFFVLLIYC